MSAGAPLTVTLARLGYHLRSVRIALEMDSPKQALDALDDAEALLDQLNGVK